MVSHSSLLRYFYRLRISIIWACLGNSLIPTALFGFRRLGEPRSETATLTYIQTQNVPTSTITVYTDKYNSSIRPTHQKNVSISVPAPCSVRAGFLLVPVVFVGTVGKALSLPWVGRRSTASRACVDRVRGKPAASALSRVSFEPSLPRTGFPSTSPRIHDQNKSSSQRTGLSVVALQPGPRFFVEMKALLTQRRVLKGRLVYPLPPGGPKECPPLATMVFIWANGY